MRMIESSFPSRATRYSSVFPLSKVETVTEQRKKRRRRESPQKVFRTESAKKRYPLQPKVESTKIVFVVVGTLDYFLPSCMISWAESLGHPLSPKIPGSLTNTALEQVWSGENCSLGKMRYFCRSLQLFLEGLMRLLAHCSVKIGAIDSCPPLPRLTCRNWG